MEDNRQNQVKKVCSKCREEKHIEDFNLSATGKLGRHSHCRACQKIVKREWYQKNREKEIEKANLYSKTEKARVARKKRWEKHKDTIGPKNNARRRTDYARQLAKEQRRKWMESPHNKIAVYNRTRIKNAIKNIAKSATTEALIGCSFEDLKSYLEQKFKPGMSWENYGKWHVDHIIPCAAFDLTDPEQQRKCFHYTNLQPLWANENLSKGSKISSDAPLR